MFPRDTLRDLNACEADDDVALLGMGLKARTTRRSELWSMSWRSTKVGTSDSGREIRPRKTCVHGDVKKG